MDQTFPPARDRSAAVLWAIIWGSALMFFGVAWLPSEEPLHWPLLIFFNLLGLGLIALTLAAPRSLRYTLTPEELQIRHLSGVTTFPVQSLRVCRTAGYLGLKVGGVGLPGYYTGNYQWKGEGRTYVQAFASTTRDGVLIESGGRSYFLTPAEVSGFLSELQQRGASTET